MTMKNTARKVISLFILPIVGAAGCAPQAPAPRVASPPMTGLLAAHEMPDGMTEVWSIKSYVPDEYGTQRFDNEILAFVCDGRELLVFRDYNLRAYAIASAKFLAWVPQGEQDTLYVAPDARPYMQFVILSQEGTKMDFGARAQSFGSTFQISIGDALLNGPNWQADPLTGSIWRYDGPVEIRVTRRPEFPGFSRITVANTSTNLLIDCSRLEGAASWSRQSNDPIGLAKAIVGDSKVEIVSDPRKTRGLVMPQSRAVAQRLPTGKGYEALDVMLDALLDIPRPDHFQRVGDSK